MTALVCGKRSFDFEDDLESYYPSMKKHRCSSSYFSPIEEQQQLLGENNDLKLGEEDFKWVDLFVKEMSNATSLDNAKTRVAMVLAARDKEKSESTNQPLTEQNVKLSQENAVLKRLVVAQHERIKGLEETKKEMEKLSGMLTQCREELRLSEMNNYALKVHISQAQFGCSSMINHTNFPPDVY
ncbi:hypothetical protein RND81_11G197500 [Saponaria officinalis]|uniref:Uncharacterized protein n=1 Tax=Saponaria officinalis TaxID=3572 RepID=A0AAW1HPP5_SAPOF